MKIKVQVTDAHIKSGTRKNPEFCPIARALRNTILLGYKVRTGTLDIDRARPRNRRLIQQERTLPLKARNFIKKFDLGAKVKPFTFFLNVPRTWLKAA